jgi:hypothetical protein
MKHFKQEEIRQYKEGLAEEKLRQQIETHLGCCEVCQEIFLTLVLPEEVRQAAELLSPNFTETMLTTLSDNNNNNNNNNIIGIRKSGEKAGRAQTIFTEKMQNLFIYYVGAAVITLFFVSNGLFQRIIDVTPQMALVETERTERVERGEDSFSLSQKAVDKAALWIKNFEAQEVRRINDEEKK